MVEDGDGAGIEFAKERKEGGLHDDGPRGGAGEVEGEGSVIVEVVDFEDAAGFGGSQRRAIGGDFEEGRGGGGEQGLGGFFFDFGFGGRRLVAVAQAWMRSSWSGDSRR